MFSESLAFWLRLVHIVFGVAGLLVMLVPVIAQKGGKQHVRFGRIFEWCCYIVACTGIISSTWWLLLPETRPELADRTAQDLAEIIDDIHFLFGVILFLGVVLLSTTRFGVRVIRCARRHAILDNWETRSWALCLLIISMILATSSVFKFSAYGIASKHSLFIALPVIAILDIRSKLKFANDLAATPKSQLQQHVDCMTGSVIAFSTAFLVLGGNRIYGHLMDESALIATFFVPTIVGISLNKLCSSKLIDRHLRSAKA